MISEAHALYKKWFPAKGEPTPRPQLVRGGILTVIDRETGLLHMSGYIRLNGHTVTVEGSGHTSDLAFLDWLINAESLYQAFNQNSSNETSQNDGELSTDPLPF